MSDVERCIKCGQMRSVNADHVCARKRGRPVGNFQGDKSKPVVVLLKPELKRLLEAAASDQFRAISNQAAKYVIDGLMRDGYIKPSAVLKEIAS